jgi:hypothetical protein
VSSNLQQIYQIPQIAISMFVTESEVSEALRSKVSCDVDSKSYQESRYIWRKKKKNIDWLWVGILFFYL